MLSSIFLGSIHVCCALGLEGHVVLLPFYCLLLLALQLVRKVAQAILLEEVQLIMSKVYAHPISHEEANSWSLDSWMTEHFPVRPPQCCHNHPKTPPPLHDE